MRLEVAEYTSSCFHQWEIHLKVGVFIDCELVSNFGDGDCGADEIQTRAQKFEKTPREGSAEN